MPLGLAAIDAALPGGGLALGALHEIVGAGADEEDGVVAAAFAAALLARLTRRHGGTGLWCLLSDELFAPPLSPPPPPPQRILRVRYPADPPSIVAGVQRFF